MKIKEYEPLFQDFPHLLHGGDYNPDQWRDMPEIINEDFRMIPLANCNAMSINIFSWVMLEPSEGKYDFSFLDSIMDRLHSIGAKAVLATPSGAKPAWMSKAHPEILRTNSRREKELHGLRHNHCFTSPYYRKKVHEMNEKLAERYKDHPALLLWHVSNEYSGECHCPLCQEAFRNWLKKRYHNNLQELNTAYWSAFWSHTYTDWSQVESPSPLGETAVHGLVLDWKRFVTAQTADFIRNETEPLKRITPNVPVTTNFMGTYPELNYFELQKEVDIISWDNYPAWHSGNDEKTAADIAFVHDFNRSLKDQPFLMMESTPSVTNWHEVNKLKRPGMHMLSSLQAVAHGSDSVQYFQWRKSRGCTEKLHGAVVDHCGHEHTRVFRDVAAVGAALKKLDPVAGSRVSAPVAVIFDRENDWAIGMLQGLSKHNRNYLETCQNHYRPFWRAGVNVDVIDSTCPLQKYKLVVAPMLYMLREGMAEKLRDYVKSGGTLVFTYVSGWADQRDLCCLGGFPGGLRDVFGIWAEETDSLYPEDSNRAVIGQKSYRAVDYCDLIHAEGAEVLGVFGEDFYKGMPALTCNHYGTGKAYYIAFRDTGDFLSDFYKKLMDDLQLSTATGEALPVGVTAHTRETRDGRFVFLENFGDTEVTVSLKNISGKNLLNGSTVEKELTLNSYETAVIYEKSKQE